MIVISAFKKRKPINMTITDMVDDPIVEHMPYRLLIKSPLCLYIDVSKIEWDRLEEMEIRHSESEVESEGARGLYIWKNEKTTLVLCQLTI